MTDFRTLVIIVWYNILRIVEIKDVNIRENPNCSLA